ncbi:hypothetical protein MPH_10594 [Macrophomina phaseolina MS6]|uniref:Uncharacterized protein n=1 Tax=Macrophomina phaseolina (strain MS6) TaxID=1126212 RepID=K2RQ03_MACPH|nr:hypothetical protein MPH_10594 [Macrophomina phaseolina MS6]
MDFGSCAVDAVGEFGVVWDDAAGHVVTAGLDGPAVVNVHVLIAGILSGICSGECLVQVRREWITLKPSSMNLSAAVRNLSSLMLHANSFQEFQPRAGSLPTPLGRTRADVRERQASGAKIFEAMALLLAGTESLFPLASELYRDFLSYAYTPIFCCLCLKSARPSWMLPVWQHW